MTRERLTRWSMAALLLIPIASCDVQNLPSLFPWTSKPAGAPTVLRAVALSNTSVQVTFSEEMEESCGGVGFYRITPGLAITAGARDEGGTTVTLTTGAQKDLPYTLEVGAMLSAAGQMLDPAKSGATFYGIATPDTAPPRVLGAMAVTSTSVVVSFSEPLDDSALNVSAYRITSASDGARLPVAGAALNATRTEVMLATSAQAGVEYALVVTNLADQAGNVIADANTASFAGIPAETVVQLPRIVAAISTGNTTVAVTFSRPMADTAAQGGNYAIVQKNVVSEAAGLIVTGAQFLRSDRTVVQLTTMSQSQVTYELTVAGVTDIEGNPMAPRQTGVGGIYDPSVATFAGTGATVGGETGLTDTDGDGLPDSVEQKGWVVVVVRDDGSSERSDVSSDPTVKDTDGDGLDDREERRGATDPRNPDTDADTISDSDEVNLYYSSPIHQDTDEDQLADHWELTLYRTSLIRSDTDGDGFKDAEEVSTMNRDPRIADLPRPRIDVGDTALRLDTRFTFTDKQGVTRSSQKSSSTELQESESRTLSFTDTQTTTNTVQIGTKVGGEHSWGLQGGDGVGGFSNKFTYEVSAGYTYTDEKTSTVNRQSTESSQQTYNDSLTTSESVDETQEVQRQVVGAQMSALVKIGNIGDTAFTMSQLEITAMQQDPENKERFLPVATLVPASQLTTGQIPSYTTGPFVPERGPFVFTSREVFPSLVEDLMRNPRGLLFKVANFNVTDEFGRNFAFVSQTVNDRTAGLTIDYGNGKVDRLRVATNGCIDERTGAYIGGFDERGRETGLPLGYVLQQMRGLPKNAPANAITVGDDGCAQSWAAGDDIQLVTPICPPVAPGGVIVTSGPNGRLESIPAGDDLRSGDSVIDGGDGCAHTVAAGDDMTVVQGACATGDSGLVVLAGPNGVLDSTPRGDDQRAEINGYGTSVVSRCDGNTIEVVVEPVNLHAQTRAAGDDVQVVAYGAPVLPGDIIVAAGANGVLDTTPNPNGNDMVSLDGLSIVEPQRAAETAAGGDDVQVVAVGAVPTPGEVIVTSGPNGVLESTPAGNDVITGPGYACQNGCPGGACKQIEVLTSMKGVANDPAAARFWVLMTDAPIDRGADLDDIVLTAGETYTLAYVQDRDNDGLFACEEYLYGSSDRRINTDGCPDPQNSTNFICNHPSCQGFDTDCLTDFQEVKVGWEVSVEGRPGYKSYASPAWPDTDADGILDHDERVYGTDPMKRDTDGDGIPDGEEIKGYAVLGKDRKTVLRYIDAYETLVIVDGGDGVIDTPLAGDDVLANRNKCSAAASNAEASCLTDVDCPGGTCVAAGPPLVGAIVIIPGPNGVLESLPAGDDRTELSQVILDGGNGTVETTPVPDDAYSAGAGRTLVKVKFASYNAGADDCDADNAVEGVCSDTSSNANARCTVAQQATQCPPVPPTCDLSARTCSGGGNNGALCTSSGDCPGGSCLGVCVNAAIGNPCADDSSCAPMATSCEIPSKTCVGGINTGDECTVPADCPGGTCVQQPNLLPRGEYNMEFTVTRDGETVLEASYPMVSINGGEGTVILGDTAEFQLSAGESFTVSAVFTEVDPPEQAFEDALPGNDPPVTWSVTRTFAFSQLAKNSSQDYEVDGPNGGCLEDDTFTYNIAVGGTVRPGGVMVVPGANGRLNTTTPGGDDFKAVPHAAFFATDPLNRDTDGDTLPDGLERALGANPNDPSDVGRFRDSDHDGLTDGEESDGWFIGYRDNGGAILCRNGDGDFVVVPDPARPPAACVIVTSDPLEADTDHDRLPDALEMVLRTDPRSRDTDGDSLLDYDEFDSSSSSSIAYTDFRDFGEICGAAERCSYNGSDSKKYGTSLARMDTDGDGLSDPEEVFGGWVVSPCEMVPRYVQSNPREADADLDGWLDGREQLEATDPNSADTDEDMTQAGGGIDSSDPFPSSCGKLLLVSIVSWNVGGDDCDSGVKYEGDFTFHFEVRVDGDLITQWNSGGEVEIDEGDSYSFGLKTEQFAMTPGQTLTVSGYTDEIDVSAIDEPPTWSFSRSFTYSVVTNGDNSFQTGPDCFSDDTITFRIQVVGG